MAKLSAMSKPLDLFFLLLLIWLFTPACQPGGSKLDPETARLQREVDSLRLVKEALQNELNSNKEEPALPNPDPNETSSNAADGPLNKLTVIAAKKQFDTNFNPALRVHLRNYATKTVASAVLAVDFSFNSDELSPNCHFEKKITLNLPADANQFITLAIPEGYGKNCADKAWVIIKEILYTDGSKE